MLFLGQRCDLCQGRTRDTIVILGCRYCGNCAAEAASGQRTSTAGTSWPPESAPAKKAKGMDHLPEKAHGPGPDRRASPRFPAPPDTTLRLRRSKGLARLLEGNLVRAWFDVSMGGLRALLSRKVEEGEILLARICYEKFGDVFELQVKVKNVSPSERHSGCYLVGVEFVNLSGALRAFLENAATGFKGLSAGGA